MASFFSDLGKTFQSAAKTIQKKTAEGMEATRRNSELRALRDEQNKLFATLGESYYNACREGGGQEQLDLLVRRIDEVAERIKAVTAELDALNDKKRCPECGAVVNMDSRFCPSCGALRQGEARFCAVCGQAFGSAAEKREEAPKPEVEINWPQAGAEEPSAEEPQSEEEQP